MSSVIYPEVPSVLEKTMHTHLTIHGAYFTAISAGAESSEWVSATITVVEMRDPAAAMNTAHWGIAIYSPSQTTRTVYLTGTEWTVHWEEIIDMVTFSRQAANEPHLRYCLLIRERPEFLRLVYYCSNIRMHMYTGVLKN
ncbi:uncharacterized protein TRAVEDRAFT_23776 [Trametes versicolor FP-101664 SS1]|uniref:uncharacterized protein n=1 Tax=Trametes versicolor (strain FP-101664) TaxID=717944 RepID=UPI0004623539|nr:uncharacterized protein TRAVEDRAFT_23776 [Trametes versicolor FP-101664 SS1]EIW53404.1 hypothetical protein TRAVEDRAFT_23776 [Trametes versicolor FP-101664 SS1]